MKDALDLFFELSNDERLNILIALREKAMKLTQVSAALKLPAQEVSRQLARLVTLDLCYRDGEGDYNLTPYADHVIELTPGFGFLSRNRAYFRTHTAGRLAPQFLIRIGELNACTLISDVLTNIYEVQQMVNNSSESLRFIIEQGNVTISSSIEKAIQRGVNYRVMVPNRIVPSKPYEHYIKTWGPDHPLRSQNAERRYLNEIPVITAFSEKEAPQIMFPTIEGKIDYVGFKAADERGRAWCSDVFDYYWERAVTTTPKQLRELLP